MNADTTSSQSDGVPPARLQKLHQATRYLFGRFASRALEQGLLQTGIDSLTALLEARHGAIGLLNEAGKLTQFVYTGITPEQAARIGRLPEGRGILEVAIREGQTLRIEDITQDSRAVGFPPNHPPMKSLLAVPIAHEGRLYGRVYLSEKTDGTPFNDYDEILARHYADTLGFMLSYYHTQAEHEHERKMLQSIAQPLASVTGEAFFRELVLNLTKALRVDYAFIGELVPNQPDTVHTIAFCNHGQIVANIGYDLTPSTACGSVECKSVCYFPEGAQKLFPEDDLIYRYGIEAFIGHPLLDSTGRVLGLLVVMHEKPIADEGQIQSILQICAGRAAVELERQHADQTLRESEERFRATFSQAAVGIAHVSTDGCFLRLNQKFSDIAGYSCDELFKRTFQDITHPDDLDIDLEYFRRMLAGDIQTYSMEKRYLRKDGSIVWINLTVSLVRDEKGNPKYFISVIEDIGGRKRAEAQMRQLSSAVEQTADSVLITDRNGVIQYVNPAFEEVTGFSRKEAVGNKPSLVKSGKHDQEFYRRLWQTIREGRVFRDVLINRKKDGSLFYEQKTVTPLKDPNGNITHFVSTGKDVTARMQAMEALRESERSLAHAQHIAHLGNWDWNIVANELRWSDEIYRIFGLTPQQFGATYEAFLNSVHPDDRQIIIDAVNKAVYQKHPYSIDHRVVRPDGMERIVHEQAEITFDGNGKAIRMIGTVQDVTEFRHAQERLNYLAHYDTLTGLPNRVLLYDRLNQDMIEADRHEHLVAMMFLDLDRFKIINDTLGHETGDALLKEVAERLKTCVRAGDTISRLGGDEFTVVLANVAHVDDVAHVAQKIIDSFVPPFNIAGRELFISTSIGITLYPFDDNNLESLLRNADAAMYHAKEMGRNTFQFYTAELNRRTAKRLQLETALRHALERHELLLHYQPQVNLKTGRIIGAEALLRWQHPEMGLIPPLDFIPLAEETGLIIPIGEWVLRTACAQAKVWGDAGFRHLQVAVNLSGRQFQHHNLAKLVKNVLKDTGLDPRYLDLELTESLLMHNTDTTLAAMDELHALGVAFSMDDFGTGYSSLSYLKRFPIDTLKIDQSFVRDIPQDPGDAAIAQAIIAMAHSLDIRVIAEGVETVKQLSFLRSHKCDGMQGYYFSKPVTAEAMTTLLEKAHRLTWRKTVPRGKTNSRKKKRSDR